LHWVRRLICLGHGTWMPASLPRMKEKRRPMKDPRYLFLPIRRLRESLHKCSRFPRRLKPH
jgi:hypothetical protein